MNTVVREKVRACTIRLIQVLTFTIQHHAALRRPVINDTVAILVTEWTTQDQYIMKS